MPGRGVSVVTGDFKMGPKGWDAAAEAYAIVMTEEQISGII